jgi:voltage-gated potassium channel
MTVSLLLQLILAAIAVAIAVLMHLAGLSLLIRVLGPKTRQLSRRRHKLRQARVMVTVGWGLCALHMLEIVAYAGLYVALGAVKTFEHALYFSTVTYASIGYGDLSLPEQWRVLGAVEGLNGILLLGWSTAFLVTVVTRMEIWERDPGRP